MSISQDVFVSASRNFPLGPSFPERLPVSSSVVVPFGIGYAVPASVGTVPTAGTRPQVSTNIPTSPDGTGRTEMDDVVTQGID